MRSGKKWDKGFKLKVMKSTTGIKNNIEELVKNYEIVRKKTQSICSYLEIEDYVVQPIGDVSPPKWHLGHTTWFFETFILIPYLPGYQLFDSKYNYVFNSYYETVGDRKSTRLNSSHVKIS